MTKSELNDKYFVWMCKLACGKSRSKRLVANYQRLFRLLHNTDFTYTIDMDGNRAEDGIDLRYRFGYEKHIDNRIIATCLDDRPCSVLEMIVALCLRCEENIMDNPDIGDRLELWFWKMIKSLGLDDMRDSDFNPHHAQMIITRFLNRDYSPNGCGGLFTIPNCRYDLRQVEIWYQAMWYFDTIKE